MFSYRPCLKFPAAFSSETPFAVLIRTVFREFLPAALPEFPNKISKHRLGRLACLASLWLSTQILLADVDPEVLRERKSKVGMAVLQNRFFKKSLRPEMGVQGGIFLKEAYDNTYFYGGYFSLFVNEWYGLDLAYGQTSVEETDDAKALRAQKYLKIDDPQGDPVIIVPTRNQINSFADISGIIAPFYGKLNLLNKIILYTDIFLGAGLSIVDTEQGSMFAPLISIGQRFYFLERVSLRIDVKDRIYTEQRNSKDSTKHAVNVSLGLGAFIL